MNRYGETFARLRQRGEIGFVPFAVAGDPTAAASERILRAYVDGGADILEIGYPFSDPVADGPVNQRAAQRAIAAGFDHRRFFSLVKRVRRHTDIPFGLLCYANSVLHLGYEHFCKQAVDAGIDSILVADLPPEESDDLQKAMLRHGLGRVFIASELTPVRRLRLICSQTDSFVYVVSRLGATGTGTALSGSISSTIRRLRSVTKLPLAVGFGISTPDHIRAVARAGADAAIVGSGLVTIIDKNLSDTRRLPLLLEKQVAAFKAATRVSGVLR